MWVCECVCVYMCALTVYCTRRLRQANQLTSKRKIVIRKFTPSNERYKINSKSKLNGIRTKKWNNKIKRKQQQQPHQQHSHGVKRNIEYTNIVKKKKKNGDKPREILQSLYVCARRKNSVKFFFLSWYNIRQDDKRNEKIVKKSKKEKWMQLLH